MKKIIVSFSENEILKIPFDVDSSLSDSEIDSLVDTTFVKIPGEKIWVNA